jgi:hypothetical protein
MTEFLNSYGAVYVVLACCLVGVLVKGMVSCTYGRLIRGAKDMGNSKHPGMKNLCNRFQACYELRLGVPDVSVFVGNYVKQYRLLGLQLQSWEAFSNFCLIFSMMTAMGCSLWGMAYHLEESIVYSSLLSGIFGNGILLVADCLANINGKKELLQLDVTDYLVNFYKPRLENEVFHPGATEEYRQEYFSEEPEAAGKVVNLVPREGEKKNSLSIEFTKEEEEIIRDVIREYMG